MTPLGGKKPEARRTNKWVRVGTTTDGASIYTGANTRGQFQIETEDMDDFREDLKVWRSVTSFDHRPPPMIIETYLDASRLSDSQNLVILDDNGKRWDVLEALNSSESSAGGSSPEREQKRNTEVILERWRVELKSIPTDDLDDFGPTLPTIYKRSIVFFRSLYVATRFMPCWKFAQRARAKEIHPGLRVKCRFSMGDPEYARGDPLRQPLYDGGDVVSDYIFGDLDVPVGRFHTSVTYRNDCNFKVDDSSDSVLNSRFMAVDENFFKPSITPQRASEHRRRDSFTEVSSLPSHRHARGAQEPQQTYGSLSTFHGEGALGTSPISALRAVRPIGSETSSPSGSVPTAAEPEPPHSMPIRGQSTSRTSFRNFEAPVRRPSVSFQPFKAGPLSGSPRINDMEPPPSPHSLNRGSLGSISQARNNRSSLTAGMAASLRGGPPPQAAPAADHPVVGSPKPTTGRYGSSFTHRRGRLSFGGQSKAGDDDQGSSGKQSLSSSVQPGSGLLAEAGGAASSGSLHTDDDNISDFLKALDSRKTLQSFEPNKKGESSAAKKTAAQLSKFHLMRESHNVLTESMTSSMHLHRSSSSSSPSSRQLANVPSMVNPASMSASSSPSKPLSPHTPYTPAIPSRLSENSIVNYHGYPQDNRRPPQNPEIATTEAGVPDDDAPVSQEGTTAIDIPLSPRLLHTAGNNRRASSVAHQNRASEEEDPELVQRSISLGGDDREAPTLSTLLTLQRTSDSNSAGSPGLQPAADIRASGPSSPAADHHDRHGEPKASPGGLRLRYSGRGRPTPPQSSRGSFSGGRYGGGSSVRGSGEEGADDEPLVFAMSELERDSRRSLEEGRGGPNTHGPGGADRAGFEPRGTSRRGW